MAANDNYNWPAEPIKRRVWYYLVMLALGSMIGSSIVTSSYIAFRIFTGV
jgi:hypothetical protein